MCGSVCVWECKCVGVCVCNSNPAKTRQSGTCPRRSVDACAILPLRAFGDPRGLDRLESIGDPRGLDRLESIDRGSPRASPLGSFELFVIVVRLREDRRTPLHSWRSHMCRKLLRILAASGRILPKPWRLLPESCLQNAIALAKHNVKKI